MSRIIVKPFFAANRVLETPLSHSPTDQNGPDESGVSLFLAALLAENFDSSCSRSLTSNCMNENSSTQNRGVRRKISPDGDTRAPKKLATAREANRASSENATKKSAGAPEFVRVRFHALSNNGDGVGRVLENSENDSVKDLAGRAVFAPLCAPGDQALLQIEEKRPRFVRGFATQFQSLSPQRATPPCPFYFAPTENSAQRPQCGGCQLQHIEYSFQLAAKRDFVVQALARIGGVADAENLVAQCVASPHDFAYRNKADFVVNAGFHEAKLPAGNATQRAQIGFFARDSHRAVDISRCLIQDETNNVALRAVRRAVEMGLASPFDAASGRGVLRRVVVRTSARGETLIVAVTTREKWPQMARFAAFLREEIPNLIGVLRREPQHESRLISGRDWLEERVEDLNLRVTGDGFFQVNAGATPLLLQTALRLAQVRRGDRVLDLYCGVGLFALAMAREGAQVLGIEQNKNAIENARFNAENNALNAEFRAGDVAEILRRSRENAAPRATKSNFASAEKQISNSSKKHDDEIEYSVSANVRENAVRENAVRENAVRENADEKINFANAGTADLSVGNLDLVLLDPPRAGAAECLAEIVQRQPRRIVYVSCDAATLARDIRVLGAASYVLREAVPLDLFPQTAHVETVALLERAR